MAVINVLSQLDDVAEFIANPNPDRPFENAIGESGRQVCDSLANVPSWTGTILPFVSGASAIGALKTVCQPYYDANGFDGPTLFPSAVTGGQCAGVLYDVVVQQNRADNGAPAPPFALGLFRGPIRSQAPVNPPVNCSEPSIPVNNYYRFVDGSNNPIYQSNSCSAFAQNPQLICTPLEPEPTGGCGDEPPRLEPGDNLPADPGPLPPELVPTLNDDGEPVFGIPPFDPGGGFPPIDIPDPPTAPAPAAPTAPPGGQTSPGDPDSVGDDAGTTADGGGEVTFGAPPAGRTWVGAFVRLNVPSAYGSIPSASAENTAFPRVLGNAFLVFSGTRFSTASRLTCEENDLFRPHPTLIVLGVSVSCLPGITATIYPVSAEICPDSECPNT